ncbi:NAD(P)/FAD-dependent oxidoreductase [Marinilactibacillus kalidii]|uniref:NAD(P)/FAD-dependent oxidoreductase n=1 Tax=Marinilactibacillus kalidii TaxID=2820274 RepID=UPI001ABE2C68|nr:NAD(P)/FAD-dependent oxidoreductase [Marinilactibacillus kalidii]
MDKQTIVVLGAGFSGVFTVMQLAEKLPADSGVKIQLVNKDPYFTYKTRLHEVVGGRIRPEEALHDLKLLFKGYSNVEIIVDEVSKIDETNQVVMTKKQEFAYDYLVLAMGGEPNDFGIEGVNDFGFTMWSWREAVKIRKHILMTVEKASNISDPIERAQMLHFVVCGGGLTGIEIMGELLEWKPQLEETFSLEKNEISLSLVEATATILPALSEKESQRVKQYFEEKQVNLLTNASVTKVTIDTVEIKDQAPLQTNTLIWTAGVQANSTIGQIEGVFGKAGRLKTVGTMSAEGLKHIYVVGDLVHYEDENGTPIPQNAQTAEQTAETAAANILASLYRDRASKQHENKQKGTIVSVGASYGVGFLMKKIHLKGPVAVIMKHVVNLATWAQLKSASNFTKYAQQEIRAAKQKRYTS